MLDKSNIRKTILKRRNSLTPDFIEKNSSIITGRLMELAEFKISKTIMVYMSARNEVDTAFLIKECLDLKKTVVVPCTQGLDMFAAEINGTEGELCKGQFGILQPNSNQAKTLEPSEIDLIVVPGVAFDRKLNRIGYGLGYYDKFLKKLRTDCFKIGLAYDFQLFCNDYIAAEEFDVPMDIVITEDEITSRPKS